MDTELKNLINRIEKNVPRDNLRFENILQSFDCKFAPDYIEFMRLYNGGEGGVLDGQWLMLWPIEELKEYNDMYGVPEFAPELFLIGSNGGGMAYGIKRKEGVFVEVEYVCMSEKDAVKIGNNFREFLFSLTYFPEGKAEYTVARMAADKTNRRMHERDPSLRGMHLHEIKPIILGGDPTDETNKIPLKSSDHSKYTRWWKGVIDEHR